MTSVDTVLTLAGGLYGSGVGGAQDTKGAL